MGKPDRCLSFDSLLADARETKTPEQWAVTQVEQGIAIETIHEVCQRLSPDRAQAILGATSFEHQCVLPDSRRVSDGTYLPNTLARGEIFRSKYERVMEELAWMQKEERESASLEDRHEDSR